MVEHYKRKSRLWSWAKSIFFFPWGQRGAIPLAVCIISVTAFFAILAYTDSPKPRIEQEIQQLKPMKSESQEDVPYKELTPHERLKRIEDGALGIDQELSSIQEEAHLSGDRRLAFSSSCARSSLREFVRRIEQAEEVANGK